MMLNKIVGRSFAIAFLTGWFVNLTTVSNFAMGSVTLSWNPSPSSDVTGYYVYYGLTSGVYDHEISVGTNTDVVISNLVEGATYYFAATSHDGGESPFSNEASCTVPLDATNPPVAITLPVQSNGRFSFSVAGISASQYIVEASPDLVHWTPVSTNLAPFTFSPPNTGQIGQQFFRAVLFNLLTNTPDQPPALAGAKLNTPMALLGQFSFTVQGNSGHSYVVEASIDLKKWTPVLTNTAPFTFTTTNTSSVNQQFFRAVLAN